MHRIAFIQGRIDSRGSSLFYIKLAMIGSWTPLKFWKLFCPGEEDTTWRSCEVTFSKICPSYPYPPRFKIFVLRYIIAIWDVLFDGGDWSKGTQWDGGGWIKLVFWWDVLNGCFHQYYSQSFASPAFGNSIRTFYHRHAD